MQTESPRKVNETSYWVAAALLGLYAAVATFCAGLAFDAGMKRAQAQCLVAASEPDLTYSCECWEELESLPMMELN